MGVTLKESTVNQSLRVLKAAHVALRSGAWEVVVALWTHPPKRAGNTGALFRGTAMLGLLFWMAFGPPAWVIIEWFELDTSRILNSSLHAVGWLSPDALTVYFTDSFRVRRGTSIQPWKGYVRGNRRVNSTVCF